MAVRSKAGRRLRWLVLAGLAGVGVWVVRSRRVADDGLLEHWPAAAAGAGAGTSWPARSDEPAASVAPVAGSADSDRSLTAVADEPTPPLGMELPPPADAPAAAEPAGGDESVVEAVDAGAAGAAGVPTSEVLDTGDPEVLDAQRAEPTAEGSTDADADAPGTEPSGDEDAQVGGAPDSDAPVAEVSAGPEPDPVDLFERPSEDPPPRRTTAAEDALFGPVDQATPSSLAAQSLFTPTNPNGTHQEAEPPAVRPSPTPRLRAAAEPGPSPGSAPALPDGSAPGPEYTIKGNADSMLFHRPNSPYFTRTRAEVWFRTATDARAAGYTEWVPKNRAPNS